MNNYLRVMNMKKFAGMLLTAVAVFSLAACGGNSKEEASQLDKIKEDGVLKVATSADFAPFEFHTMVDGKDQIVGADIDMVNEIGKELGVKVEVMDMGFNTVLAAVKEGKADIAVSGISATAERKESFDFTDNYYNPPQVLVINKNNAGTFTSIDSLKGKKIGAQKGSVQEGIVENQLKDSQLVSIEKVPNMILEVNKGSLDGMVVEKTIAESYVSQNPDLQIADVQLKTDDDNAFAIAIPKGSSELQKELNTLIKKMNDEGKIDEYVKKNNELAEKSEE